MDDIARREAGACAHRRRCSASGLPFIDRGYLLMSGFIEAFIDAVVISAFVGTIGICAVLFMVVA
jgi:hypothetical protein